KAGCRSPEGSRVTPNVNARSAVRRARPERSAHHQVWRTATARAGHDDVQPHGTSFRGKAVKIVGCVARLGADVRDRSTGSASAWILIVRRAASAQPEHQQGQVREMT